MLLQVAISTTCTNVLYSVLLGMTNKSCKLMALIKLFVRELPNLATLLGIFLGDCLFTLSFLPNVLTEEGGCLQFGCDVLTVKYGA